MSNFKNTKNIKIPKRFQKLKNKKIKKSENPKVESKNIRFQNSTIRLFRVIFKNCPFHAFTSLTIAKKKSGKCNILKTFAIALVTSIKYFVAATLGIWCGFGDAFCLQILGRTCGSHHGSVGNFPFQIVQGVENSSAEPGSHSIGF